MPVVEGVEETVWSIVGEQGFCPALTVCPLVLGSLSFFTLSDEPFDFTSVLSASLTGTCLADLVPWLIMAGTEVALEAVVDAGCGDDDNDDDASGGEAADAFCLNVVWTASKAER